MLDDHESTDAEEAQCRNTMEGAGQQGWKKGDDAGCEFPRGNDETTWEGGVGSFIP
jgi:hypothetical protein